MSVKSTRERCGYVKVTTMVGDFIIDPADVSYITDTRSGCALVSKYGDIERFNGMKADELFKLIFYVTEKEILPDPPDLDVSGVVITEGEKNV